jgi:hypothetical protein
MKLAIPEETICPKCLKSFKTYLFIHSMKMHKSSTIGSKNSQSTSNGLVSSHGRYHRLRYKYSSDSESDDGASSVTSSKIRSSSEVDFELQNSKIDSSQIKCQICSEIKYFKNNNGLKIHNSRCHKKY